MRKFLLLAGLLFGLNGCYPVADEYYLLGYTKYLFGDYREALTEFSRAIEIDPDYEQLYYSRGFVKCNLSDYEGAAEDFNKVIGIEPNHEYAYYIRGIAKFELGDLKGACLDWINSFELGIGLPEAYELILEYCW